MKKLRPGTGGVCQLAGGRAVGPILRGGGVSPAPRSRAGGQARRC